jgi:hypothetical protein
VVVTELVSALKLKREQRKYKLTPDENMGALERGCFNVRRDYGLQMRNNKVTPVYSKDHSIAKTEGAWISTFLINTCGMVTGKYDDYIIANYATTATHLLASAVCQRAPGFEGVDVDDDDTTTTTRRLTPRVSVCAPAGWTCPRPTPTTTGGPWRRPSGRWRRKTGRTRSCWQSRS